MKATLLRPILVLLALTLFSLNTVAGTFIVTDDELDAEIFPQVAESIRVNLDGPNAPQGMTPAKRQQAMQILDRIENYLVDDPDGSSRKVRNEQARLNALLAPTVARNDSRSEVICQRRKKVGTNIPTTVCRTRAEMEAEEYAAEEELARLKQLQSLR